MSLTINYDIVREDTRKLGLVLMGGGFLGIIIDNDKITTLEGYVILFFGVITWMTAVLFTPRKSEEVSHGKH